MGSFDKSLTSYEFDTPNFDKCPNSYRFHISVDQCDSLHRFETLSFHERTKL